jgi:UDP-N-acetylmuramate dehydrogenase
MSNIRIQEDKYLREVCTFGIGGPARYFIEAHTVEQAQEALAFAADKQLPFHVLGKGSNTLFDDQGFNGVVILNKIDFLNEPSPGVFHAGGGYSFSLLGVKSARQGWSGLEFACGIPATVGGAIFMNAGANGSETSTALISVDFMDVSGRIHTFLKKDLHFSYRSSSFQKRSGIIISAIFSLISSAEARQKQLSIIDYRKRTQPYTDKSAGCAFRNPGISPAGKLIDPLKGLAVGSAKVSEKHANFIINAGGASCHDVLNLMALIREKVKMQEGVELESEIRYIPYKSDL